MEDSFTLDYTGAQVNSAIAAANDLLNRIYPVGSIYISVKSTNPNSLFGGTWAQIQGRFLLGQDSRYAAGSTGGEETHTLTVNEMPGHTHSYTDYYANTTSGSTTLTVNQIPAHSHTYRPAYKLGNTPALDGEAICGSIYNSNFSTHVAYNAMGAISTTNAGGGGGHTHSVSNTSSSRTSGSAGGGQHITTCRPISQFIFGKEPHNSERRCA